MYLARATISDCGKSRKRRSGQMLRHELAMATEAGRHRFHLLVDRIQEGCKSRVIGGWRRVVMPCVGDFIELLRSARRRVEQLAGKADRYDFIVGTMALEEGTIVFLDPLHRVIAVAHED